MKFKKKYKTKGGNNYTIPAKKTLVFLVVLLMILVTYNTNKIIIF
jgi:hypothetical protein